MPDTDRPNIWSFGRFRRMLPFGVPPILPNRPQSVLKLYFPTIPLFATLPTIPEDVPTPVRIAPNVPSFPPSSLRIGRNAITHERAVEYWIFHNSPDRYILSANGTFTLGSSPLDPDPHGPIYRILAPISRIGVAEAAWAIPVFDDRLPLLVVLFLPPGELETPEMLCQLAILAEGSVQLVRNDATAIRTPVQ
ncbi:hypothetical protein BDW22DRAFT_1433731 [Trametopsis cervina]|nr:hypothetical protein BDW22DRAFT_1433731 [Trametopsis cervina]